MVGFFFTFLSQDKNLEVSNKDLLGFFSYY